MKENERSQFTSKEAFEEAEQILKEANPYTLQDSPEVIKRQTNLLGRFKSIKERIVSIDTLSINHIFTLIFNTISEDQIDVKQYSVTSRRYDQGKIIGVEVRPYDDPKKKLLFKPTRPVIIEIK